MKIYLKLFLFLLLICSCNNQRLTTLTGLIYGTTYNIQFYSSSFENYSKEIDNIFNEIDNSMSTYKPNSIISKVNNNQLVRIDYHFKNVFNSSKKVYQKTKGRFDPSVGLMVNYWGFGSKKFVTNPKLKSEDELFNLLSKVGLDKFEINDDKLKRPLDSYIDFNAIAKGYAVDQVGSYLISKQVDNYLVEIGGEINASGINLNKNKPWVVAIDMPRFDGDRSIHSTLELNNNSLASSGNYRKFKIDSLGNRYAHIINPLTGYPSKTNILSVTIKSKECVYADAYATAFHTMSISQIEEFLENSIDMSALVIYENSNKELTELNLNNFYK